MTPMNPLHGSPYHQPQYPLPYPPHYPPNPFGQAAEDESHLRGLSVMYWVAGGIAALATLLMLVGFFVGIGEARPDEEWQVALVGVFGCLGAAFATLTMLTGTSLAARRRRTLCVVTAAITCAGLPLGTILGVVSLIVLQRPTVRQLFH
jgi:hypothetical protein